MGGFPRSAGWGLVAGVSAGPLPLTKDQREGWLSYEGFPPAFCTWARGVPCT
jgi:hypothetical protein